jgi:protein PhnA
MHISLENRSGGTCECCSASPAQFAFTVSPKKEEPQNQVALCDVCFTDVEKLSQVEHWRCVEGSIWNPEAAVQALSYRIANQLKGSASWAQNLLDSVEIDEDIVSWANSNQMNQIVHLDAFGNTLENGDTVVLTQALDVKGTSFSAPKGTVVKKIRLVHDQSDQIEGKINEQTIVILTKFVKKN